MLIALVVYEILKIKNPETSELERVKHGAKACVVLFPLLGMTWVFGVLSVTDAGLSFQYIFTILNSLQVLQFLQDTLLSHHVFRPKPNRPGKNNHVEL